MIDTWHAIRLFAICALLSFITNFPAGVPTSSLNTALSEFRSFIHESYVNRGWELANETELLIRTVILNSWYLAQFVGALTLFPLAVSLKKKEENIKWSCVSVKTCQVFSFF